MNKKQPENRDYGKEISIDAAYWNERWLRQETGWDVGYAAPAIAKYLMERVDKNASILIPGCGNAYEAAFLLEQGFTAITVLDFAPEAVQLLQKKFEGNSAINVVHENFFDHEGSYDVIVEQTFFCAIHPQQRLQYAQKAAALLRPKGRLTGLLFNKKFEKAGPPFGGNVQEYRHLFEQFFIIEKMEPCYNSIAPRAGAELFVVLRKAAP